MKSSGKKIVALSLRLREALRPHFDKASHADDLAFHLAEIQDELSQLHNLVKRVARVKAAKKEDLGTLYQLISVHWPYHLRAAKRLLDE